MARMLMGATMALALSGAPALAQSYCSRPLPPNCLATLQHTDDEGFFQICRSQVSRYLTDVNTFRQCVTDEANRTIERFNCKARREVFCP